MYIRTYVGYLHELHGIDYSQQPVLTYAHTVTQLKYVHQDTGSCFSGQERCAVHKCVIYTHSIICKFDRNLSDSYRDMMC